MERLRLRDLRAVVAAIAELAPGGGSEPFPERALAAVHRLVPSDISAYNEIDLAQGRAIAVTRPAEALRPGLEEILAKYGGQHPVLRYHERTGSGEPLRLSDFL